MKRKLLIMIIAVAMLITFMPVTAYAQSGWYTNGDYYWYYDPVTGDAWTGWHKIGGYWYYFAKDDDPNGYSTGQMYDEGPMTINGKTYYFGWYDGPAAKWGKMQYGWIKDTEYYEGGLWYYADPANDGQLAEGWKKINNKWYYFAKEGDESYPWHVMYFDGPQYVNGYYYYFGNDGDMKTGWIKESGVDTYDDGTKQNWEYWYYADPNNDSRLATGWKKISGKWYWFYSDGEMFANDTKEINGKRYAFNRDGSLHETAGWVDLYEEYIGSDGKTYKESYWVYTDAKGVVKTGWQKISGTWYCFDDWGYMYHDEWASDSKGTMWMDSNGKITKSKWIKYDDGEWYYLKADGYLAVNEWVKDSAGWLYVDGNGMILKEAWANDSLGTLWMDSNGRITKSQWLYLDDGTYYVDANGYMVTGSQFIDGAWWTFFDDGKLNAKG